MNRDRDIFRLIEISIVVAILYGIIVGISLSFRDTQETKSIYQYIQDWKELISATIALLGAWMAYSSAINQHIEDRRRYVESREREEFAARAVLTMALSHICRYAESYLSYYRDHENYRCGRIAEDPVRPTIDNETITHLRDAIRSSDESTRKRIAEILGIVQINEARAESYISERAGRNYIITRIYRQYDCLLLYTKTSNLFNYARVYIESVHGEETTSIRSALNILVDRIESVDEMSRLLDRRHPSN